VVQVNSQLVNSRSPYDEDVSILNSVNDIRNGMLLVILGLAPNILLMNA
jgi:hypothetical protein